MGGVNANFTPYLVQGQPTFDETSGIRQAQHSELPRRSDESHEQLAEQPRFVSITWRLGYLDTSFRGGNQEMYMKFKFTREDDIAMRTLCNNLKVVKPRTDLSPEQLDQVVAEGGYVRVYFAAVPNDIGEHFMKKNGRLHVRGGHMTGDTSQKSTGFAGPKGNFANLNLFLDPDAAVRHLVKTCLLYTSPSPRDQRGSRMPSSA